MERLAGVVSDSAHRAGWSCMVEAVRFPTPRQGLAEAGIGVCPSGAHVGGFPMLISPHEQTVVMLR